MPLDQRSTILKGYSEDAARLTAIYNNFVTEDVSPGLVQRLHNFQDGESFRALELGCGSGRDAYWLAEKRYEVVAVDGSERMLDFAREHKSHERVRYIHDLLPDIKEVKKIGQKFDLVLMSAVFMHLDDEQQRKLMENLASLTNKDALVYITLRQGESPPDRPMYKVSAQEVITMAGRHGMKCEFSHTLEDKAGRAGTISWDYMAFRR